MKRLPTAATFKLLVSPFLQGKKMYVGFDFDALLINACRN